VATRTEALRLIADGRVRVDGIVVRSATRRVDPGRDRIDVDGRAIGPAGATVVVALNKPRGRLVTRADPEGRPTVEDLLPSNLGLLRAVGRLDRASAGLLLATTDTRLAAALLDPERRVLRVYRVKVRPAVTEETRRALEAGVALEGERLSPDAVEIESRGDRSTWLRIGLREGKNREIRRLCEARGLRVLHLVRIAYGPVGLGTLAPGEWRLLSPEEIGALRETASAKREGDVDRS
jgi:23S rRNA pseudouridine2605 synthase